MPWLIQCVFFVCLSVSFSMGSIVQNETEFELIEGHRQGRVFPFYSIGRIANLPCVASNGLTGTCLVRGECADNQGISGGTCSTITRQATCCVFSRTCGGSTSLNSTYFTNVGYPGSYTGGGSCTFTITPGSESVCQLRIDFRSMVLAQPDGDGNCLTDVLTITGGSSDVPPICGENTGQHVYVNFDGLNPITIRVTTTAGSFVDRMWNFQLSQIPCASQFRAPDGCLQYYMEQSGVISSFNYGFGANPNLNSLGSTGTRQIAGQRYGICIRAAADRCSVTYSLPKTDGSYAFTVTGDAEILDPSLIGMGVFGENGNLCTTDYVVIPDPVVTSADALGAAFVDRFCGLGLFPVTSRVKPFVVYVVWDNNELGDVANRGFRIAYSQNACTLS